MAHISRCPHCKGEVEHTAKVCPHCFKGMAGAAAVASVVTAGTPPSAVLLLALAVGAGAFGFASLSQATAGVGMIAGGLLLAVWARIAQAAAFHKEQMGKR